MFGINFTLFLLGSVFTISKNECDLKKFEEAGIVPNIVREVPKQTLEVKYSGRDVKCGENLSFETTAEIPDIKYDATDGEIYTLFLVDPDAPYPGNATASEYLHWFVIDIPGNNVGAGRVLKKYRRPEPPTDSPAHRYVLIVTHQPGYLMDYSYLGSRANYNMTKTMDELGFKEITAGNFFYVKK